MAKNLKTFMPGLNPPAQLIHGYELFSTYSSEGSDMHISAYRNQEYGRARTRLHLKQSMCDIRVNFVGGGEGGAGHCCCMQGDPGYGAPSQRYSVCCHTGSGGTNPIAGVARCNEYIMMCLGAGGCVCTTCNGHEGCMSTMHHCGRDGESYICICAGGPNGGSILNCFWGYSNDNNRASRGLNTCWNSLCKYDANCTDPAGQCRAAEHPVAASKKAETDVGWSCVFCQGCGNAGFNMYRGQCCSDGRCGVYQMSSGPNWTSPYQVGNHILAMGTACQQEHSGHSGGMCWMWYKWGQHSEQFMHFHHAGRSTSTSSGCAGGCKCGSQTSQGLGWIRWKDPDYELNGNG